MRAMCKFTWMELKLFLREPIGTFFMLAFPMLMLLLFGGIYGNAPSTLFGGRGTVDVSVPAYTGMIIATAGILNVPIVMATYRERGILRRLKVTPARPWVILGAQIIVTFVMTAVGMVLLIILARVVYGLRFDGNPLDVTLAFLLANLSFFALGSLLAGALPTARSTQIVAMVLFYPMLFLSGAGMPREILPQSIQNVSRFLPLTYVVDLLKGMWFGEAWSAHLLEVSVLVGILIGAALISTRTFRWE